MKKGLTFLTIAFATTTLFGCNSGGNTPTPTPETSKITSVKVQAVPYALYNTPYKVTAMVEGEGKFSTEVNWSTNNKDAYVVNGIFIYVPSGTPAPVDVEVTATSVQDNTKKASSKISVIAATTLTQEKFKEYAKAGDAERKKIKYYTIDATPSENDCAYFADKGLVSVDSAQYQITAETSPFDILTLRNNEISKPKNSMIHTAEQLDNAFNNQYKGYATWFEFTENSNELYGYYVYKPAMTNEEEDLFKYTVFQKKDGLPYI